MTKTPTPERNTLDEADNVVPKSISKVVNGNIIVIDQYPDNTNELVVSVFKGTEQVIPTFGEDTLEAISRLLDCLEQSIKTSDYKKQINELQSALGHQKHLNNAMAKELMPKEYHPLNTWIKVGDRLPEIGQSVYVHIERDNNREIELIKWTKQSSISYKVNGFTHWMPAYLPELPTDINT